MFKRINLLWDNINDTFNKLNKSNLKITDEELNIINELVFEKENCINMHCHAVQVEQNVFELEWVNKTVKNLNN